MGWMEQSLGIHTGAAQTRILRAEVIASNLAHASTPGYRPQDVNYRQTMAAVERSLNGDSMATEGRLSEQVRHTMVLERDFSGAFDGKNTVNTAHEQTQFAQNSAAFDTSMTFLTMKLNGLRKVIEG